MAKLDYSKTPIRGGAEGAADLDRALKKFNRLIDKEGIPNEIRKRQHARSKSEARRYKDEQNESRKAREEARRRRNDIRRNRSR